MLTDAASVAVGLGISSVLDGHFEYHEWVATMPFLVAPSIVHGLHRRPVQAVLSPVMRLGFPLMGAAIGRSIESCEPGGWLCGVKGTVIGGGVGLLTALVVDYSIARAPAATVATTSDADRSTAKAHGPLVSITAAGVAPTAKGGASLVLGGSF